MRKRTDFYISTCTVETGSDLPHDPPGGGRSRLESEALIYLLCDYGANSAIYEHRGYNEVKTAVEQMTSLSEGKIITPPISFH